MTEVIESEDDESARKNHTQSAHRLVTRNHSKGRSNRHQSIIESIDNYLIPELSKICLSYLADDRLAVAIDSEIVVFNVHGLIEHSTTQSINQSINHPIKKCDEKVKFLRSTLATSDKPNDPNHMPIYQSIKTKSVIHRLHFHDNRLITINHNEKVIRLHSIGQSTGQLVSQNQLVRNGTGSSPSSPTFGPINQSKHLKSVSVVHLKGEKTMTCLLSLPTSQSPNQLLIGFEDGSIDAYNTHTGSRMYSISQSIDQSINQMIAIDKEFPTSALASLISRRVSPSLNQSINQSVNHIVVFTNDHIFRLIDLDNHRIARFVGKIDYIRSINQSTNQSIDSSGRIAVLSEKECAIVRLDSVTRERTVSEQSIKQSVSQSVSQMMRQSINQSMNQSIDESLDRTIDQSVDESDFYEINQSINQSINQLNSRPVCFSYLWSKLYAVIAVQSVSQSTNQSINLLQIWRIGSDRPLDCMASLCIDQSINQSVNQSNNQNVKHLVYLSDGMFAVCFDDLLAVYRVINQSTNQSIDQDEPGPHWQDPNEWTVQSVNQWRIDGKVWIRQCLFLPAD